MGKHLMHRGIPIHEIISNGKTRYQFHLPNNGGVIKDTLKEVQETIDAYTIRMNEQQIKNLEIQIHLLKKHNEKIKAEKWP